MATDATAALREWAASEGLDDRDATIAQDRMASLDATAGPRVGDFVRFACGTLRRISYHWHDGAGWDGGYQTSDGGSFYLGNGHVSMSGSLHPCVPADSLTRTDEEKAGSVWFFHHDQHRAHNGVNFDARFRVYTCNLDAPR